MNGPLDSSNFFWLKRDSISYPDLFRKKLARKHLKQLINHKKKKSLRRKQAQLLKNRILPSELPKRPNIILMMADDQDTELGSLQFMPKLNRFLREEGELWRSIYKIVVDVKVEFRKLFAIYFFLKTQI